MREKEPTTYEEAIDLSELWDQTADNETEDRVEYHRLRRLAAHYRVLADCLPSEESALIRNSYPGAACPDCGDDIPIDVMEFDECENCSHIFGPM